MFRVVSFVFSKKISIVAALSLGVLGSTLSMADESRNLVVFGHNPYEQGNFPSLVGTLDHTYSGESGNRIGTGPSIADVVSQELFDAGIITEQSTAALFSGQGTNYATTTAATRLEQDGLSSLISIDTQVNSYLGTAASDVLRENLYIFAPGQNDVLDAVGTSQFPLLSCGIFSPYRYHRVYRETRRMDGDYRGRFEGTEYERVAELMYAAISTSENLLDQLQAAGARNILVPNVSSPALFPILERIAQGFSCDVRVLEKKSHLLTKQFNRAIKRYVKKDTKKNVNSGIVIYDVQSDIKQLKRQASAYGFTDVDNNCYLVDASQPQIFLNPEVSCDDSNENTFLHYAALTLTADADEFIGRGMAANLRLMTR